MGIGIIVKNIKKCSVECIFDPSYAKSIDRVDTRSLRLDKAEDLCADHYIHIGSRFIEDSSELYTRILDFIRNNKIHSLAISLQNNVKSLTVEIAIKTIKFWMENNKDYKLSVYFCASNSNEATNMKQLLATLGIKQIKYYDRKFNVFDYKNQLIINACANYLLQLPMAEWNMHCDYYDCCRFSFNLSLINDEISVEVNADYKSQNNLPDTLESFSVKVENAGERVKEKFSMSSSVINRGDYDYFELVITEIIQKHAEYKYILDSLRVYKDRDSAVKYISGLCEDGLIEWEDDDSYYDVKQMRAEYGDVEYLHKECIDDDCDDGMPSPPVLEIYCGDYLTIEFMVVEAEELTGDTDRHVVAIRDLLVRTDDLRCTERGHRLEHFKALVSVNNGYQTIEIESDVSYCPVCDRYYMLESEYVRLKRIGYICCRVVKLDELSNANRYGNLKTQSLMREYGYTVNAMDGLSSTERHRRLDFIIDNDIESKAGAIGFLRWLIDRNMNRSNMNNAIKKWEEDINYLNGNRKLTGGNIRVNKIFLK